jgi:hypothetical protein
MNIESLVPFAIIITPFAIAFFIEALVIYFFKIKSFWAAIGFSLLINLITVTIIFYMVTVLLGQLNYEFNGLHLPIPVVLFLWWFSSVVDGLLMQLFFVNIEVKLLYRASILMNALSYLLLYIIIVNSH